LIPAGLMIRSDIKILILFFSFLFLLGLFRSEGEARCEDIHLFAGAGLRQPVDQLIDLFREQTGCSVIVDYAGAGNLLARIIASGRGDLFMPGSFYYIQRLEQEGLVDSFGIVVYHTPVIGVNRDKAHLITSFQDLARPGVRLALGDPEAMAFGRVAMDILEKSEIKDEILKNVVVYGATVKQMALYVAQGDADASIIGRADAVQYQDRIKIIPVPEEYFEAEIIAIAILKKAADRPEVIRFRDFMASENAIEIFRHFGFLPIDGAER
jgi:molybdate transport system substrate-binding protein